jgi:hypothetical protein
MAVTSSRRAMCHVRFKASGHPPRLPPMGGPANSPKRVTLAPHRRGFILRQGVRVMGLELIGAFTMIGIVIAMLVLIFHFMVP